MMLWKNLELCGKTGINHDTKLITQTNSCYVNHTHLLPTADGVCILGMLKFKNHRPDTITELINIKLEIIICLHLVA